MADRRSSSKAVVLTYLPNVEDYLSDHREKFLEERQERILRLVQSNVLSEPDMGDEADESDLEID